METEWGPFAQYYLFVTTDAGTQRYDTFAADKAAAAAHQAVTVIAEGLPAHGKAAIGNILFSESIKSVRLIRVDSIADFAALPSIDD